MSGDKCTYCSQICTQTCGCCKQCEDKCMFLCGVYLREEYENGKDNKTIPDNK